MNLEYYIQRIDELKEEAAGLPEDVPATLQEKTELLVSALKMIGEVAAEFARLYKKTHRARKTAYAHAYKTSAAPKALNAELIVAEIEELEADYYADMHKYRNDFESTQEEIHALKQKMRINFAEGTIGSRWGG